MTENFYMPLSRVRYSGFLISPDSSPIVLLTSTSCTLSRITAHRSWIGQGFSFEHSENPMTQLFMKSAPSIASTIWSKVTLLAGILKANPPAGPFWEARILL